MKTYIRKQNIIILLLLFMGSIFSTSLFAAGPGTSVGCDNCPEQAWGTAQSVDIPYGSTTCSVRVHFRKRLCAGYTDVKFIGIEFPTGCMDAMSYDPVKLFNDLIDKGLESSSTDYYGILPGSGQSIRVRFFRAQCWVPGNCSPSTTPPARWFFPCVSVCCILTRTVSNGECGHIEKDPLTYSNYGSGCGTPGIAIDTIPGCTPYPLGPCISCCGPIPPTKPGP